MWQWGGQWGHGKQWSNIVRINIVHMLDLDPNNKLLLLKIKFVELNNRPSLAQVVKIDSRDLRSQAQKIQLFYIFNQVHFLANCLKNLYSWILIVPNTVGWGRNCWYIQSRDRILANYFTIIVVYSFNGTNSSRPLSLSLIMSKR